MQRGGNQGDLLTANGRSWGESPGDIAATRHSFSSLQEMLLAKSSTVQKVLRFLELDA